MRRTPAPNLFRMSVLLKTCTLISSSRILFLVDVDLRRKTPMDRHNLETVGVRLTGWADLDHDPPQNTAKFIFPHSCPHSQNNPPPRPPPLPFTTPFLPD